MKENNKIQIGIMCESSVEEYEKQIIKKHEVTIKKKELDRTKLTVIQNANAGPVFLTYHDIEDINKIIDGIIKKEKPFIDIITEDDKMEHILWKCTKEESEVICKLFQKVPTLYIADGHHRCASACTYAKQRREETLKSGKALTGEEDFNYFMSIIYPCSQIFIDDYNRLLKTLNDKKPEILLKELEKYFKLDLMIAKKK